MYIRVGSHSQCVRFDLAISDVTAVIFLMLSWTQLSTENSLVILILGCVACLVFFLTNKAAAANLVPGPFPSFGLVLEHGGGRASGSSSHAVPLPLLFLLAAQHSGQQSQGHPGWSDLGQVKAPFCVCVF